MAEKLSPSPQYDRETDRTAYSVLGGAGKDSPHPRANDDLIAGCSGRTENGLVGIGASLAVLADAGSGNADEGKSANGLPRGVARTVLENGVSILTESVPSAKSVSMGFVVEASPRDEREGEQGLAHMCEHMMFQGTSSRSAFDIARQIDQAGGSIGAFTTRDYTCYYASVPDDHTYHAIDLMGDILLNATFPETSLEREKAVTACELGARRDVPSDWVHGLMKSICWPHASLGRPIAGDAASVGKFDREDVIYFVHRNYTPDRLIIAAAGNLVHEDFVAQCRDAFWRLIGEGVNDREGTPAAAGGFRAELIDSSQAYFSIGIPTVEYPDPARYAVHLLVRLLGGGVSSRLYRAVRNERGLVYDVGADYEAYRDAGLLSVRGSAQPESLHAVLSLVYDELEALGGRRPITEEELAVAKTQVRGAHVIAGGDVFTRMSRLATQQLYFQQPLDDADVIDAIERVTSEQINEFVHQHLQFGLCEMAVAVAGPQTAIDATAAIEEQLGRVRRESSERAVCPPVDAGETWTGDAVLCDPVTAPFQRPNRSQPVEADAAPEFLVRRGLTHGN